MRRAPLGIAGGASGIVGMSGELGADDRLVAFIQYLRVLAVAYGAGADTTFIVAVQSLRVVAMVLVAPLAVRWLLQRGG